RVALGAGRAAIALVVNGPDVEAVSGEHVHQRVLALAGNGEVEGRAGGDRRPVDEEEDRPGRLTFDRRAGALAEQVERDVALLRPVLRAPWFFRRGLGGRTGTRSKGADGEACPGDLQ